LFFFYIEKKVYLQISANVNTKWRSYLTTATVQTLKMQNQY